MCRSHLFRDLLKRKKVLILWSLLLLLVFITIDVIYTPYDYAGFLAPSTIGEGVAHETYPSINTKYQVVYVTCEQWQFMFYPHAVGAATTTVVRATEPVLFIVRAVDVTHGFYVNTEGALAQQGFQFGVMAVPGYTDYVVWSFQPTAAAYSNGQSLYHVFCSEYCGVAASGLGHPWMDALIIVVPNTSAGLAAQSTMLGGNLPQELPANS
jgi:cytochrome c oxidase subunit 2